MTKYGYTEFFQKFPEIYHVFHRVVGHAENYYEELKHHGLLRAETLLSIGSGEGELEAKLAHEHGTRVGVVEPNPVFMKAFKQRLGTAPGAEAFPGTFQDYPATQAYDAVIAVQSWYAFGTDRTVLEKALSCVKPGGKLMISLISESSLIWRIARLAGNEAGGRLSSESLAEWAREEGFQFDYSANERRIPQSRLFMPSGELTEEGRGFASFPTFMPWSELDAPMQASITGLVRQALRGLEVVLTNGCLWFEKSAGTEST